jgi:periplasmic copper chaperone A
MRFPAVALLAFLFLAGCGRGGEPEVSAAAVWVRLPAAAGQPGSAYFTLQGGAEGTKLVGVSSPLVRRIELHESETKAGVARMKKRREVEFPSRGGLRFEPGGRHAMLFGIADSVKPGGRIPLTFAFNTAPPVTVDAEVRDISGDADALH